MVTFACTILRWAFVLVPLMSFIPANSQNILVDITVLCSDCTSNAMIIEGDVVTIQCMISRQLQSDETIFIEQNTKDNKNVKWLRDGSLILPNSDNNPIAANVQMSPDGSVQYGLTFTAVNRTHTGQYQCSVFKPDGGPFFSDSVDVDILYLPNESFPICSYNGILDIGEDIELTCLSEDAHPNISLQWTQGNSTTGFEQMITRLNGTVESSAVIVASLETNGTTFTCTLESPLFDMFPGQLTGLRPNCTIGPFHVRIPPTDNTGDYGTIFGLPFAVFVISATGIGTFLLISLILLIIYACCSYRCACLLSRKRYSISGPGGRHGSYDFNRSRGSVKDATDIWTEKRPSRVAPPPPNRNSAPYETNLSAISELSNGQNIAMNSYLAGSTDTYPPPPSYPDEHVNTFPPPPEEWLNHDEAEDQCQSPGLTSDTGFLLNAPDGHSYDSEWSEDEEEEPYGLTNPAYQGEDIYQNSANIVPNHYDQQEPSLDIQPEANNNIEALANSSEPDEDFSDIPVDPNSASLKHRGSRTLPRLHHHDFPEYAKPHKVKLQRTSSMPSRNKSIKPSKPSFQPPPPPGTQSTSNQEDTNKAVIVKIGPSTDAAGYASVTVSH